MVDEDLERKSTKILIVIKFIELNETNIWTRFQFFNNPFILSVSSWLLVIFWCADRFY